MNTTDELIRDLYRVPDDLDLGRPDLAAIHRAGRGHRRRRRVAALSGSVAMVAALGLTWVGGQELLEGAEPSTPVATATPEERRALAELRQRALEEIPGARKVSPGQVVIPADEAPRWEQRIEDDRIAAGPVPLPAHTYTGVTVYPRKAFAPWLHDGVEHYEQNVLGDPETGYPVGSTDVGILVDFGTAELACLATDPGGLTNGENLPGGDCYPAVLARVGDTAYLKWSMGTDRFLERGAPIELFTSDDYSTGEPATLWIGGRDGTDVARVDFVTTDGRTVPGDVEAGTLVPGDSMFWARVPGELATVVAYDADGTVLEEHPVRPCSGGVDCEVR